MRTLPRIYQGTNEYYVTLFCYSIYINNMIFIGLHCNLQKFRFHVKCSVFVSSAFHDLIGKTKTVIYLRSKRDACINLASAGKRLQNGLSGLILQTTNLLFFLLPRKQDLTFHAIETIYMKCKSCSLGRMRKIFKNVVC